MKKVLATVVLAVSFWSCGKVEVKSWQRYDLPEGYKDAHILSIDSHDKALLVGTFGRGALFDPQDGSGWAVFDTGNGLSWNFVMGGDWDGDYMVLATLGDGLNISLDRGKSWERYGYNFFGVEYLYAVTAKISDGKKFVPTADGLVVFDSITDWRAYTERDGLGSQYLYDIKVEDQRISAGTLHGYAVSHDGGSNWISFSPNGKYTPEQLPACKVRAVEFMKENLYAGCDDGLYVSTDGGKTWGHFGRDYLTSPYVRDLVIDKEENLWIATYREIAVYNSRKKSWQVYNTDHGLPPGGANCLEVMSTGEVLAGTNYGIFRLVDGVSVPFETEVSSKEFSTVEEPLHQWMLRPVRPNDQNCKDQTYLYGSTMGGNFRQHQGNEYNAPEGTALLAVDDGIIVYIEREIGHSVLKCDRKEGEFHVYAHYHHQSDIYKKVGERVKRGEIIGAVGKLGNVTNEHLHFEVSLSKIDDSNKESHTRNSELWIEPLEGTGTIVGSVVDERGKPLAGVRIYGVTKPVPTETPFSFAETYKDMVHPDEWYKENFAIGDVPEGTYILTAESGGLKSSVGVAVEVGKVTRVRLEAK